MMQIDVIHPSGHFSTIRLPEYAYGSVLADYCRDPSLQLERMDEHGAEFREAEHGI